MRFRIRSLPHGARSTGGITQVLPRLLELFELRFGLCRVSDFGFIGFVGFIRFIGFIGDYRV